MYEFNRLNEFKENDVEKQKLLANLLKEMEFNVLSDMKQDNHVETDSCREKIFAQIECDMVSSEPSMSDLPRVCPECGRHFSEDENFCPECLVSLKHVSGKVQVRNIRTSPNFTFTGSSESDNILTDENFSLINDFDFTIEDFNRITRSIRAQAFENMDKLIKDNSIDLDDLDILDKVLLFAMSFVSVEYKSYGRDLGYFEFNRICVDDRQRKSLQITTLIHELSHFLIKEILLHITCKILDVSKNEHVESVITYILSSSILNRMIDEYSAHSVEGRFTMFGYQDYSSFIALQSEIDPEHVEIAKTIGNTFSIHIKSLLEGFLDWELREEIKEQFLDDTIEGPDYSQLAFESCSKLSDEGFLKAIWLILTEGFKSVDVDVLESYMKELKSQK